jgi:hypothetical protein
VSVDGVDCGVVCDGDMVRLYPYNFAVFLVQGVNGKISASSSTLVHQPKVGKSCWQGTRDFSKTPVPEIWKNIVQDR